MFLQKLLDGGSAIETQILAMLAYLWSSTDPEVKANVDEQQRLFDEQLKEWQKLDVEYQLDMASPDVKPGVPSIEDSGAYSGRIFDGGEHDEWIRDFIRKQKVGNLSARLLPKIELPRRWEATKMIAGGNELKVDDYIKIVEGRGVSGDTKATSYGRIHKLYLPTSSDGMSVPSDGVNSVCMLFETHVTEGQWRTSGTRIIEFAKLNEVPVKVAAPRQGRSGQPNEIDKQLDKQKSAHQPRSLEYAGVFRCAATLPRRHPRRSTMSLGAAALPLSCP